MVYDNVSPTSKNIMEQTINTFEIPSGWRRPKTHFMDANRKSTLASLLTARVNPLLQERHQELIDRLLALGGDGVAIVFEEDLDKILARATPFKGSKTRKFRGRPCNCHQNSAMLWKSDPKKYRIVTGWALSPDGCWRQHTWVAEPLANWDKFGYQFIETTERRTAYYGFMMTEKECRDFYYNQI